MEININDNVQFKSRVDENIIYNGIVMNIVEKNERTFLVVEHPISRQRLIVKKEDVIKTLEGKEYDAYDIMQIEAMQDSIESGMTYFAKLQGGDSKTINIDYTLLTTIKEFMIKQMKERNE